jgi:hypothetical protein
MKQLFKKKTGAENIGATDIVRGFLFKMLVSGRILRCTMFVQTSIDDRRLFHLTTVYPDEFEIDDSSTVRQLKQQLATAHHCKLSECRLIYLARVLRNDNVLSALSQSPTKPITLMIERAAARASDAETLDAEFVAAITAPPLCERLGNPGVLSLVDALRARLGAIAGTKYADVIRRLELIPLNLAPKAPPPPPPPPDQYAPKLPSLRIWACITETTASRRSGRTTGMARQNCCQMDHIPDLNGKLVYDARKLFQNWSHHRHILENFLSPYRKRILGIITFLGRLKSDTPQNRRPTRFARAPIKTTREHKINTILQLLTESMNFDVK